MHSGTQYNELCEGWSPFCTPWSMGTRRTCQGVLAVVAVFVVLFLLATRSPRQTILLQETISPVSGVATLTPSAIYPRKPPPPWRWSAPSNQLPFNCTHGTRQVPAVTERTSFHLIFLGKPRNVYLSSFCNSRGYAWHIVSDLHSVSTLGALVPNAHVFPIILTTAYAYSYHYMKQFVSSKSGLVMSIRRAHMVTGSKSVQLLAYRREFERFGCHLEDSQLMPSSFLLHAPKECQAFFNFSQIHQGVWWVLKPEHGQGGEGITVHGDVKNMSERFGSCSADNEHYVVQAYIPNLLLLDNHKFDVRAFVLIASTAPFVLFYHDGYLRVTVKEFSDDLSDLGRHLTNTHYQKGEQSFSYDAHLWSFRHLQSHLQVHHPERKNFVTKELVPFIKNVGRFLLGAGKSTAITKDEAFGLVHTCKLWNLLHHRHFFVM